MNIFQTVGGYRYNNFDWKFYISNNQGLQQGGINTQQKAWRHWITHGIKENRITKMITDISNKISHNPTSRIDILKQMDPTIDGVPKYNMYQLNMLNNNQIIDINQNIDFFYNMFKKFKKILFICSDYPSSGGAATNCDRIQQFFIDHGHQTFAYYFKMNLTKKEYKMTETMCVNDLNLYVKTLSRIHFVPDLIFLKTFVNLNLRNIHRNCPIVYLIGGIYKNNMNQYHHKLILKSDHNKYINGNVLYQIRNSDLAFSNSFHTHDLLLKYYGLKTFVFYSSFIQYYNKTPLLKNDFYNRPYDYALIVSDFIDRPIKNVRTSMDFLRKQPNTTNILLVGKNSTKLKKNQNLPSNFTCLEIMDHEKMNSYYKNIKYIVQDSFYESCSNVKIEGLYNGCKMKPVIVFSSTQYPGYGGAATNTYSLIKHHRKMGFQSVGVFFHKNTHHIQPDPDKIGGIFLYKLSEINEIKIYQDVIQYLGVEPTICFAKNYKAPVLCKKIFQCPTVYLVSGINHFSKFYYDYDAQTILDKNFKIDKAIPEELECNNCVDLIICNSNLSKKLFSKIYPSFISKICPVIYDTSQYVDQSILPIRHKVSEKSYDVVICCSDLSRKNKNTDFLIPILKQACFHSCKKAIIGKNYENYVDIENTTCFGLLSQVKCLDIIGKSKIILVPSKFDANPNIVREASKLKCIPLITNNVGNSDLYPESFVCDSFQETEWTEKIKNLLENYDKFKNFKINFDILKKNNELTDIFYSNSLPSSVKKYSNTRILLSSTQYPGNGGAATNTYKLNRYLLENGINVFCVFFLSNKEDTSKITIDPDNLGNVAYIRSYWKDGTLMNYDKNTNKYMEYSTKEIHDFKQNIINYLGGPPDLVYAKNYRAPITCRILFPNTSIYYLVSGVYMTSIINNQNPDKKISAQNIISQIDYYKEEVETYKEISSYRNVEQELKTLALVDGLIFNSELTEYLFHLFYGDKVKNGFVMNTSLLKDLDNTINSTDFYERDYDIIFVCSSFKRKIKNPQLVNEIFMDSRFDHLKKIAIGNDSIFSEDIPNLTVMKQQLNSVVYEYMRKSRLLLMTSLFDSSPNVVYEALDCGCNVVMSQNVGNYSLMEKNMVCKDIYDAEEWKLKILEAVKHPVKQQILNYNLLEKMLSLV